MEAAMPHGYMLEANGEDDTRGTKDIGKFPYTCVILPVNVAAGYLADHVI